jgi:transposase
MPLTTRRATRLMLKRSGHRTNADTHLIAQLEVQHHDVAVAIDLVQDFCPLIRARQADRFDDWLARAMVSAVGPLQRFAAGLRADDEVVKAGIGLPWSNGPVEWQINRLKMLKRSMFWRATLDLLSRWFLLAA